MNRTIIYMGTLLTTFMLNAAFAANTKNDEPPNKPSLSPVGLALMGGVAETIQVKNSTEKATAAEKEAAEKEAAEKAAADKHQLIRYQLMKAMIDKTSAEKAAAEKAAAEKAAAEKAAAEKAAAEKAAAEKAAAEKAAAEKAAAEKAAAEKAAAEKVEAEKAAAEKAAAEKVEAEKAAAEKAAAEKAAAEKAAAEKAAAEKAAAEKAAAEKAAAEKVEAEKAAAEKAAAAPNPSLSLSWMPQPQVALTDDASKDVSKKVKLQNVNKTNGDLASQRDYPFEQPFDAHDEKTSENRKSVVKDEVGDILAPSEIGTVMQRKLDAQGAAAYPGYAGKKLPSAKRKDIDFSTDKIAPTNIKLAQNVPSAIVFLDKNGTPWPIESIAYDPRVYSVNGQGCGQDSPAQAINDNRPTNLSITVCNFWTWGTFTVKLENISIPLAFVAESGQKGDDESYVDVPIIIHIADAKSPSKEKNISTNGQKDPPKKSLSLKKTEQSTEQVETIYQSFLTGETPTQAIKITTSDANTSAWIWRGQLYFRTKYQILAPNYELVANNDDATVYKFARSTSRIFGTDGYGREHIVMVGN